MRFPCLLCVLLAGLAYGQSAQPAPSPAPGAKMQQGSPTSADKDKDKAPEVKVAPDETVLTIKDFCVDSSKQGEACKTTLTKAQFDKLAEALQPGMSPAIRRQLATAYARMLKMSTAAEKRGLDKSPAFEQKIAFARMQVLSQELTRTLQEDSNKISDAEMDEYYKKNEGSFVQATLARIMIPRTKQVLPASKPKAGGKADSDAGPTDAEKKAAEESMTKFASEVRARAVKGEDPDTLEKEAYTAAGMAGTAPSTKMEKVRRTSLPASQQKVMDLKPGEVSEVISEPNSAHYVFKMISVEALPLDKAKPEILRTISGQRYKDSMAGFQGGVDLNDAYFGATRTAPMPPMPKGPHAMDRPAPDPD